MARATKSGNRTFDPGLWMKGALPDIPIVGRNVDTSKPSAKTPVKRN